MKVLRMWILLALLPAFAFGQFGVITEGAKAVVVCPQAECYAGPYFGGTGGFVAMASTMDDEDTDDMNEAMDSVAVAVSCGRVVKTMEFTPDEDGIVRQAFTEMNGLACADGGGSFIIHGVEAGGWYWINDTMSSAVSSLVPLDVYGNPPTMPVDPGGVTITPAAAFSASEANGMAVEYMAAASYVSHEMSGRVGIIPHIMPTAPVRSCGGTAGIDNQCHLNAAYYILLREGDEEVLGDTFERPATGDTTLTVRLGGTGFINFPVAEPDIDIAFFGPDGTEANDQSEYGVVFSVDNTITVDAQEGAGERCDQSNPDRDTPLRFKLVGGPSHNAIPAIGGDGGPERILSVTCPALP